MVGAFILWGKSSCKNNIIKRNGIQKCNSNKKEKFSALKLNTELAK